MESILSVQDEIYPLKTRRNKSLIYVSHHLHGRSDLSTHAPHPSQSLLLFYYQRMKQIFAQRSLYILGILNLCLAALAIVCVTQAEDYPEYFHLVYVAIAVFVFYMVTILFIIVLQIVQTYRRSGDRMVEEVPTTIVEPSSKPPVTDQRPPMPPRKARLSRSQTLPSRSLTINPLNNLSLSTSTSSSTLKENSPIRSAARLGLLSKAHLPANYHSIVQKSLSTSINHHSQEADPQLSPLIKPIPLRHASHHSRA